MSENKFRVRFTADLITEVEDGELETESGWVDWNWTRWDVEENREDVRFFDFETREEAEEFIGDELGAVEHDEGSDNYYAADTVQNYQTGVNARYAAHIEEL